MPACVTTSSQKRTSTFVSDSKASAVTVSSTAPLNADRLRLPHTRTRSPSVG